MWKVGQKLICVKTKRDWDHTDGAEPKYNEVVTFNGFSIITNRAIYLVEYPITSNGNPQSFDKVAFKPLEYSGNAISEILEKFKPEECRPDVEVKPIEKLISNH